MCPVLVSIGGFTGISYSPTIGESFNKLKIYKQISEFEELHDVSTSRYALILITLPIVAILFFYNRCGYPFLKSFLLAINGMTNFMQDMLVYLIPILLMAAYYIVVIICFGRLIPPNDLFQILKQKISNIRLKKYMRKNNIPLSYLETDRIQEVLTLNSIIENSEKNTKLLERKIEEIKREDNKPELFMQ